MRRRARHGNDDAPGQDSFLDIVANLVGILIILVMIVGARAKDAMLHADNEPVEVQDVDLRTSKHAAVAVRTELEDLLKRTKKQEFEIAYRKTERDRMLTHITATEKTLAEQRGQLSGEQQIAHQLQRQLAAAEQEHQDLKLTRDAIKNSEAPVKVLEHRPTPLAKTVFGREVHFRLKGGRLAFVPLDELVDQFKTEAQQKVWKLRQAPRITETVGPVGGFRLKYTLKRSSYSLETRAGTAVQQRVELDHFVLVPVRDDLGEAVDSVLAPGSEFRAILQGYDPNQATITIWVYPECFRQFRVLKDELHKLGFLTASRPMPAEQPISGSPNGTYSAAQ